MFDLVKKLFASVTRDILVAGCTDCGVETVTGSACRNGRGMSVFCFSGPLFRLFYGKHVCALALGKKYPALLVCRQVSLTH